MRNTKQAGRPSGTYVGNIGNWNVYRLQENRYKICAVEPVRGKANYFFGVKNRKLDSHAGLNYANIREERPEIFVELEHFFDTPVSPVDKADDDPYGDLAISRRRQMTPEQHWKRGLLHLKRIELEHTAANKKSVWESAVRTLYAALFKKRIDDREARRCVAWIEAHGATVNMDALLQAEQDYYTGKFAPDSSATLEAQFDLLAGGSNDPIRVEPIADDLDAFR